VEQTDILIERARSLVNLRRLEQAISELKKILAFDPENIDAILLITGCYLDLNENTKAIAYADELLRIIPDFSVACYYKAICLDRLKKSEESEKFIIQAIQIDPYDADYFGFLSGLYIDRHKWDVGLKYADQGLQIDPENRVCLNHRTLCLTKLNRKSELISSIENTLQANPYDSYTHSNVGWAKLENGNHKEAKEHFAEALRINPNSENARLGMVEAIKAKNFIYKLFLDYSFWISKQQGRVQWLFIIGFFFLTRLIGGLAKEYPILNPIIIFIVFVLYLSWIINPLSNSVLFLDKLGRYALKKDEKIAALIVSTGLFIGIILVALTFLSGEIYLTFAIFVLTIIIPLSKYFELPDYKRSNLVKIYTIALALVGLGEAFYSIGRTEETVGIYLFGFIGYQWLYNYVVSKK